MNDGKLFVNQQIQDYLIIDFPIPEKKSCLILKDINNNEFFGKQILNPDEVLIQSQLNHPNIMKILNYIRFENQNYIFIFQKALGNFEELFWYFQERSILFKKQIIIKMLESILNVHESGFLHGDIKMENFVILKIFQDFPIIKLIDFGSSKKLQNYQNENFGTDEFLPPEFFKDFIYDIKSETWAMGIIIFKFLFSFSFSIFSNLSEKDEILKNIDNEDDKKIILLCLNHNPSLRPSIKELLNYFQNFQYFEEIEENLINLNKEEFIEEKYLQYEDIKSLIKQ